MIINWNRLNYMDCSKKTKLINQISGWKKQGWHKQQDQTQ